LASNSLLEGVVFAKRAVSHILGKESSKFKKPIFDKEYKKIIHHGKDREYKRRLREIMWEDVGIIRTKRGLLKPRISYMI